MRKKIILIGDSISEAFDAKTLLPQFYVRNYGISGDSTVETLQRIDKKWFFEDPEIAFLCIGTNDFARNRSDEFILDNIDQIISKIYSFTSNIEVIPVSVFPTRQNEPRPNIRIRNFNRSLEDLAVNRNLRFFNISCLFRDNQGELKSEYTEDGLHLTNIAYLLWARLIIDFISF